MLTQYRIAGDDHRPVDVQPVGLRDVHAGPQRLADLDLQIELLADLPDRGLLVGLSRLDLAARKLPATVRPRPVRRQHQAVPHHRNTHHDLHVATLPETVRRVRHDAGMPLQNRVLPTQEIVADPGRGLLMGNRGSLHRPDRRLGTTRWRSKAWICCVLDWKGIQRDPMPPGRWTALFFFD